MSRQRPRSNRANTRLQGTPHDIHCLCCKSKGSSLKESLRFYVSEFYPRLVGSSVLSFLSPPSRTMSPGRPFPGALCLGQRGRVAAPSEHSSAWPGRSLWATPHWRERIRNLRRRVRMIFYVLEYVKTTTCISNKVSEVSIHDMLNKKCYGLL